PTHDVGAPVSDIRDAWDDRLALANPGEVLHEVVDPGGTGNVRGLLPATIRSDHAGEQQRQIAQAIPYFLHGFGEAPRRNREHAFAVLELARVLPLGIEPIGAAIGRAPIDRDEALGPVHVRSHAAYNS